MTIFEFNPHRCNRLILWFQYIQKQHTITGCSTSLGLQ
nr:MAG TPA: hypothetical protein [Caudoviricetes sp.]